MVDGVCGVHGLRALRPAVVDIVVGLVNVTALHRLTKGINVMEIHRKQSHATHNIVAVSIVRYILR